MTPYGGNLTPEKARYNRVHSRARCVVEQAFGCLKARWRCLLLQLPVMEENLNSVICSCLILHNFSEERGGQADCCVGNYQRAPIPETEDNPVVIDARQLEEGTS